MPSACQVRRVQDWFTSCKGAAGNLRSETATAYAGATIRSLERTAS